jgi:cell division protein FtsI/penicillin-binding protein 2
LVTPRVVEQTEIETKPLDIQETTIDFLRESMKSVITTGTGRNLNKIEDITIYAKTGTGQTYSRGSAEKKSNDHAWFVAYFQHLDDEPLVLVILLEYVGSSRKATRIAQQFLKKYKKVMKKKEASK